MINTGWTGGPYGVGKRMDLTMTRQCIQSITRYKESDLDCFSIKRSQLWICSAKRTSFTRYKIQ